MARKYLATALLATALVVGGLLPVAAGASGPVPLAAGTDSAAAAPPIAFAIAVDESGSIQPDDMSAERDAAARIAMANVSPTSTVDIFGFASANTSAQHAVDTFCPPLTLDRIGRSQVDGCTAKLQKRSNGQGNSTDFPAAIRQGVAALKDTPAGTPRVLFMLTDGQLDVHDSPSYGDLAHRDAEGVRQLGLALGEANAAQVQIWPLGFGPDVNDATMRQMAAGGFQHNCAGLPDTAPAAQDVHGSADVGAALEHAFASAGCIHEEPPGTGYPPTTQHVHISVVATVGTIVVAKGDPAVTVTYTDPNGKQLLSNAPPSGSIDGAAYDLAGQRESVESLQITDPVPGDWTVHMDAPAGHRGKLASVSVLWHGELRTSITLSPPNPQPGGTTVVTLTLLTRMDAPITDPRDLQGMQVAASLVGAGFTDQALTLADNGVAPDAKASDGAFTGTATVPSTATGAFHASATLSAIGLTADADRSDGGQVSAGPPAVSSRLLLADSGAHPGESVHGTLELRNNSNAPHQLAVSVRNTAGSLLTVDPPTVSLAAGETRSVPVALKVAGADAFRTAGVPTTTKLGGTLTVADSSAGGRALSQDQVSVTVTPTPTFLDQYGAALALAGVVLLALVAAGVLGWQIRRWNRRAHGLRLELSLPDGTSLSTLPAGRTRRGNWFEFRIVDGAGEHPTLAAGAGGYAVRRDPRAGVLLRITGDREQPLTRGRPVTLSLGEDRELLLSLADGAAPRPPKPGRRLRSVVGVGAQSSRPNPGPQPETGADDAYDPNL